MRLPDEARATLLDLAGGDARGALNILEAAAAVVPGGAEITPEGVAEAAQQRLLAYDRVGDQHYEAASAFIKSMRGNDPDAALYWCASMVARGGSDLHRSRIVIAASEDVGNADPRALQIAVAAMHAVEMIELPEAQYALAQAAAYVASAPKSNRAGAAYFAALAEVEEHGRLPVPLHLRPAAHRPHSAVRLRSRLSLPARLRRRRRGPAVPPRRARGPGVLRALRGGAGAQDRGAAPAPAPKPA